MTERAIHIPEIEFILCLSQALDLVNSAVAGHHRRVAAIAAAIAAEAGFPPREREEIIIAASLHDAGALTMRERLDCLTFDIRKPHRHAETGYLLLHEYPRFLSIASLIRHHHVRWDNGAGREFLGREVDRGSHVLHLADRIDILLDRSMNPLSQANRVRKKIAGNSGSLFAPGLVEAFRELSCRESFWLEIATAPALPVSDLFPPGKSFLGLGDIEEMANVFTRIVDFRSRFTVLHSAGVAAAAESLAAMCGMYDEDFVLMRIAGRLHDLGKLAVPAEILDKPSRLDAADFNVIKSHTFHTHRVLQHLAGLETITKWAAFHHERIDGTGYPFHVAGEELAVGARVMAVADVFVALTEDRPYRPGMQRNEAMEVLRDMAGKEWLDGEVVSQALKAYDELDGIRIHAQDKVAADYRAVRMARTERAAG